jgi:parvulin-like peptidyl-prolyl isomerase
LKCVLSCLAAVVCVSSCSMEEPVAKKGNAPVSSPGTPWADAEPQSASPPPGPQYIDQSEILVTVNGEHVLKRRIYDMIGHLREQLPEKEYTRREREAVSLILQDLLVEQFLKREGYEPTSDEMEAEIERRRRIYKSSAGANSVSLEEALRRQGTSIERMREAPTVGMRFSCYVRSKMTEEDLAREFETSRYMYDETKVRASHILFDTRSVTSPAAKQELRNRAEAARARALAGEDFADLARELSDCPTKDTGGDLGFFRRRGDMVEPFAAAAFALADGAVSEVVETQYGYHVIKRTGSQEGKPVFLADVRDAVADTYAVAEARRIYGTLRESAKIEWHR